MRSIGSALGLLLLAVTTTPRDATAAPYVAPSRSLSQVSYAIGLSHPKLPDATRDKLAKLLVKTAKTHNFDALSGWAIIDHESHWRANAVSADGEDIGLAQIRYTTARVCQEDRSSEACQARRERLLDPLVNIRAMGHAINAWRKLCTEKTGKAPDMKNWLAGYGGYSRPADDVFCGRQKVTTKKGEHWKELPVPGPVTDIINSRKAMLTRLRKERVR